MLAEQQSGKASIAPLRPARQGRAMILSELQGGATVYAIECVLTIEFEHGLVCFVHVGVAPGPGSVDGTVYAQRGGHAISYCFGQALCFFIAIGARAFSS